MRTAKTTLLIILLIFVVAGSAETAKDRRMTAREKRVKALELLDKYAQALDSTASFIEHFEQSTKFSYYVSNGTKDKGKQFKRGQYRHDDQRFYYQVYTWGRHSWKDVPEDKPYYNCNIADGRKNRIYQNCNNPDSSGSAGSHRRIGKDKVSLSRHFGVSYIVGYIGSDQRLDAVLRKADRISVRKTTENVNGCECFVIDADTKCGRYSVWLDTEHGFHPAKVRRRAKGGDYTHSRLMSKGETARTYLDTVRFEKVDDIWVPMEADAGCYRVMPSGDFVKEDYHYKRTQIILNPDHDKLGSFADPILEDPNNDPELKNGTRVSLNNQPTEYTWQDGKVVDYNGKVVEKGHMAGASLVGKDLPDLTGFVIEPRIEKTDGKRLLVCFFDMNQRPSRHCVGQLNERAEQLREQGVFVVSVQASQLAKKGLDDWIKKDRISLPIGMVDNDGIKTRKQWGVQSLPWLIMTDEEHIVTAEGFGLDELEDKIKEGKLKGDKK